MYFLHVAKSEKYEVLYFYVIIEYVQLLLLRLLRKFCQIFLIKIMDYVLLVKFNRIRFGRLSLWETAVKNLRCF